MAIVQLKSTNPEFSFIIKKNPQSGMQLRSVRKGLAYGWYTDPSAYNVYFKDADNDISYKQDAGEQFEYLNVSRYNTPLFPLNAIGDFFSAPLKTQDPRDTEGYEHTFWINMIHIPLARYVGFFDKHFPELTFELRHHAHHSYSLAVTTRHSLYRLLHAVSALCLFLAMFGEEQLDITEDILDKYVRSIQVIDAPFYIRSLFARHFLSSKDRFKKYRAMLEDTGRYAIQLDFGGTAHQRRRHIGSRLAFDKSILDIGCGEGFYASAFAGKTNGSYYAVDINEEAVAAVNRKAQAKELDNIVTFGSIEQFLETYNGEEVDIIVTEVVEHMSEEEAAALIRLIGERIRFGQCIITTPNAEFNRYYELSGFRHEDHKWEMSREQFSRWLSEAAAGLDLECEWMAIGDRVNDVPTTQGAILKKKEG
ncbi:class I SAM-dependent methyltransferase [Paenibacillus doosanensis]|uniref:Small RNA 2'-O-methyltransferase n=1 Tax=Paenibacillus konkukensis TaxID=2020716 RepID=A0ABY4RUY8_9BACL|nr:MULTISPECIES: class I SAM-dependent methyltransferase [Paenibacillus]MCS7460990.1 class I SAM-dependent methyltransferase [Paenibacillus doosanensis]UQZ85660.1 bifunctional 3-demethylubiquinone-9 3-methyltransferase/ 2-octaprenyl-6-hydroxy phenol methylase [Paenibacillus konkukensis]